MPWDDFYSSNPPVLVENATITIGRERSPDDDELLNAPVNDSAYAGLVVKLFRHILAFVLGLGWKYYDADSGCWKGDGQSVIERCVEKIAAERLSAFNRANPFDGSYTKVKKVEIEKRRQSLTKYGNAPYIARVAKVAANHLNVDSDAFDNHPHLLNVANGIVDLRTGEMSAHDPTKYLSYTTGIPYDPAAKSELWEETISDIADGDQKIVDFLQLIAGVAATGDTSVQKFFYFFGQGANGKSLITSLWSEALGGFGKTGYAAQISNAMISGRSTESADTPSSSKLKLQGRRIGIFDEQDGEKPFDARSIKALTGGDNITARAPHDKHSITFAPAITMIGMGNSLPAVNASDYGVWRRIVLIHLKRTFPVSNRGAALRANLPAILTWSVRGAMRFYEAGKLTIPDSVLKATEDYRDEADPVRRWLKQCADINDPGAKTDGKILRDSFVVFCKECGEAPGTYNEFSMRLKAIGESLGFTKKPSNGHQVWIGIRLR